MTHAARVNDREHQLLGIGETAAAEVFETCAHASLALALQPFPAESQSQRLLDQRSVHKACLED